jgi:6-phosphogluconolactonase
LSDRGSKYVSESFVKTRYVVMLSAMGLLLSGCPVAGGGAKFTVGGTLTGLNGSGLVLEINGGDSLAFTVNGGFNFGNRLANNAAYSVTVQTQPSNPAQTCTVRNGSGTVGNASVTNVLVSCKQTGRLAYVANRQSNTISAFAIASSGALVPIGGSPFAANGTTPTALAVDPDGQFLYVANSGSNTVGVFSINAADGTLTSLGLGTATGTGPGAIVIDPTDHFLYVANLTSNDVSAYVIDNGALTPVTGSPFSVGAEPASLAIDPNGNFLYATNFNGNDVAVFLIDLANGILSNISGSPFATGAGPASLAIDPTDAFAFIANEGANSVSAYSLNATTGALTAIAGSPFATTTNPESLAVDPAGRYLFAANVDAVNQVATYAITPSSGALTLVSAVAADGLPISLAVEPTGQFLYAVNFNSNDVSAYTVGASGALTAVAGSPFAAGAQPHAIAID